MDKEKIEKAIQTFDEMVEECRNAYEKESRFLFLYRQKLDWAFGYLLALLQLGIVNASTYEIMHAKLKEIEYNG